MGRLPSDLPGAGEHQSDDHEYPEMDQGDDLVRRARRIERYVGQRIRARRTERGVTQQELARALGISYQQVQKYENGSNRISAGRLYVVARLLGVDLSYFFPSAEDLALMEEDEHVPTEPLPEFSEDAVQVAKDLMAVPSPQIRGSVRALLRALKREVSQVHASSDVSNGWSGEEDS
ncbi:MAG: helix-turn-helix domain-containing protein [Alphaproteobacteria bacterium]|nr:MAG: helix-turn-helix domain-containing protein [Alphaproteobacteria bacterium]